MESITKTQNGTHEGFEWEVSITKSPVKTYTATAIIYCQMHTVELHFPDKSKGKKGLAKLPFSAGSYLNNNPYNFIVKFIEGFIDGRNEKIERLLEGGKDTKNELIELLEGNKMRPMIEATEAEHKQMQDEVDRLISHFGAAAIAHLVGIVTDNEKKITYGGVRKWSERGRAPAAISHKLCLLPEVKEAGFTRESLRPDVKSWVQMDYPTK